MWRSNLRLITLRTRAPALFAALLRGAGVAPALLPLLAEPARVAVRGLAITARRKRPAHTAAFLAALREVCAGAGTDAAAVAAAADAAAARLQQQARLPGPAAVDVLHSDLLAGPWQAQCAFPCAHPYVETQTLLFAHMWYLPSFLDPQAQACHVKI